MNVVTGSQVLVFINGVRIGRVTSFRWRSMTPRAARMGLDSLTPHELSPVAARVQGEVGLIRTHHDGGVQGLGIVADFKDIPRERYFSLLILDVVTQRTIFRADYCTVSAQAWGVTAKGVMEGSFSFDALDWSNEAQTAD